MIDLFCGAGGLSYGFATTGQFHTVLANDYDSAALETYAANMRAERVVCSRIEDLVEEPGNIPAADVVVGGPPCQGFSLLNKSRDGDPRRSLWQPYLDVVAHSDASIFVMENVPQLLASHEFEDLRRMAAHLGFDIVFAKKLCAADFGVPQERYRAFVIASRIGFVQPPLSTHASPELLDGQGIQGEFDARHAGDLLPWRTVSDAIADLRDHEPTTTEIRLELGPPFDLHFTRNPTAKSVERYKAVPPGGNRFDLQRNRPDLTPDCWLRKKSGGTDLFGRLWWDRPAVTIRTEFFKPEKGRYLHPERDRPITHREAARFQGFPDEFRFQGSKTQIARQIGNAVPPPLAAAIGAVVADALSADRERIAS